MQRPVPPVWWLTGRGRERRGEQGRPGQEPRATRRQRDGADAPHHHPQLCCLVRLQQVPVCPHTPPRSPPAPCLPLTPSLLPTVSTPSSAAPCLSSSTARTNPRPQRCETPAGRHRSGGVLGEIAPVCWDGGGVMGLLGAWVLSAAWWGPEVNTAVGCGGTTMGPDSWVLSIPIWPSGEHNWGGPSRELDSGFSLLNTAQ